VFVNTTDCVCEVQCSAVLRNQSYVWKSVRSTLFRLFFKLFIFVFKAKGVKEGAVGRPRKEWPFSFLFLSLFLLFEFGVI